jgi:general stress protein 26
MIKEDEIESKLWKALATDRTVMLALEGVDEGHSQPMTAQVDDSRSVLWFFGARNSDLVHALGTRHRALLHFASKGHDLFASLHGELSEDRDRKTIDRLWNRHVAAWYPQGKDDPQLILLRFEPERAQVWLDETSLVAAIKIMMGRDPRKEYQDKVAELDL